MKVMIISDIHGGLDNLKCILEIYRKEKCEKLIILGDLFNYGIDYYRDDVIEILNNFESDIVAVRGNCDENINGIYFDLPYVNNLVINNKKALLTHGHLYSKEYLLNTDYDIIMTGHSHIPLIEQNKNKIFINPGSITKARRGENSFALMDNNSISIRNLDNNTINIYYI